MARKEIPMKPATERALETLRLQASPSGVRRDAGASPPASHDAEGPIDDADDDGGARAEALLREQAEHLGVTAADAEALQAALDDGRVSYQDVFGLTDTEMQALAWRAEEHLRQHRPADALKIYLALTQLSRFEASYYRGAAQCFHHMREYGFAHGAYGLAIATDPNDLVSKLLRAECLLHLDGKQEAATALDAALAEVPHPSPEQRPFVERAAHIRSRIQI
jgi:tetratricopeptide (TPR) repeat protein